MSVPAAPIHFHSAASAPAACHKQSLACLQLLQHKSTVFSSAHPLAVSEYVNEHVGNHGLRLQRDGRGTAALAHRKFGSMDLCRLAYGSQARVVSDRLHGIYHLQFILSGSCRYELANESIQLLPGQLMIINPEDPVDLTYSDDCEKFILRLPAYMMESTCLENRWHKPVEGVRFSPIPYQFNNLKSLFYLLSLICQEAEAEFQQPWLLSQYNRVITTKLMTELSHNVSFEAPTLTDISFERLVDYIEKNIKSDLCVEKLAAQAYMSTRSVYMLFKKHANATPKQFIRDKKLQAVHQVLTNPECGGFVNITALALEYGFTHLGRFAETYRKTYGVLPSETLKRHLNA